MGEMFAKWQEYKCRKVVQAVKINEALFTGDDDVTIVPADASVPAFTLTREWWNNRSAKCGGYCVLYNDGYMSWSPAKEFEDGYTKMDGVRDDDAYLDTVDRLEPNIAMIDNGAGLASVAISLKRIADAIEEGIARETPDDA